MNISLQTECKCKNNTISNSDWFINSLYWRLSKKPNILVVFSTPTNRIFSPTTIKKQDNPPTGNHKRHTARSITCASHIQFSRGWGGGEGGWVPHLWMGVAISLNGRVPICEGYPIQSWWEYPHSVLTWVPPSGLDGVPPPLSRDCMGYPLCG